MRALSRLVVLAVSLPLLAAGCGGGKAAAEQKAAEAKQAAEAEAKRAEAEQRKREREAKQAAEEEAEKKRQAELDALVGLPEDVPKQLDKACAQMLDAYDAYMQEVLEGDQLTKWKTGGNEMQLTVFRKECQKGTPQIAACQAHAFSQAKPEMKDRIADFMRACRDRFGSSADAKAPG